MNALQGFLPLAVGGGGGAEGDEVEERERSRGEGNQRQRTASFVSALAFVIVFRLSTLAVFLSPWLRLVFVPSWQD